MNQLRANRRLSLAAAIAAFPLCAALQAQAAPLYQAVQLPDLKEQAAAQGYSILGSIGGGGIGAAADNGIFLGGAWSPANVGFRYAGGALDFLSVPGHGSASAFAVNISGVVAGSAYDLEFPERGTIILRGEQAVLWGAAGAGSATPTRIGTLGGSNSQATGINDAGTVVGNSWVAGDTHIQAFVWNKGAMQPLFDDGKASLAYGVNNRGDVIGLVEPGNNASSWGHALPPGTVGSNRSGPGFWPDPWSGHTFGGRSFAYIGGQLHLLDEDLTRAGVDMRWLSKINEAGAVLGNSNTEAFVWQDGQVRVLETMDLPANFPTELRSGGDDINSRGDVVGWSGNISSYDQRAVLWTKDGELVDLNDTLQGTLAPDVKLIRAFSIDDASGIYALGSDDRIYQLTLVPEPSTAMLTALGLAAAGSIVVRRRIRAGRMA